MESDSFFQHICAEMSYNLKSEFISSASSSPLPHRIQFDNLIKNVIDTKLKLCENSIESHLLNCNLFRVFFVIIFGRFFLFHSLFSSSFEMQNRMKMNTTFSFHALHRTYVFEFRLHHL